jgi:hypothetical protein
MAVCSGATGDSEVARDPLVVTVTEPETGASWEYVFEAGPVVVGRGDGVQLCLDRPFVSLQHGTFDFDDAGVTYVDLDSRNGTVVDGVARGERPSPVTDATELRIGKLRLRVSRVAPVIKVGVQGQSPFAPRVGRGPAKGTDALPAEALERIRQELVARKEAPPPPVVAALSPTPVPPLSEPPLEKTVPVPMLTSRPLPEVGAAPPLPAPYDPGGTRALPALPRPSTVRRTPRPAREVRPRRPAPPPRRWGTWLPVGVGVAVVSAAAILLLTVGGGERRLPDETDRAGTTATVDTAPRVDQVVAPPVVAPDPAPEPLAPDPPPPTPPPRRARPPRPPGEPRSPNRSPILP